MEVGGGGMRQKILYVDPPIYFHGIKKYNAIAHGNTEKHIAKWQNNLTQV